ncbi:MAG TPA: GNAT family N-acetyltransferase, partial [Aquabacterium sp.]|nr:GNAT family N-acetyltransferase [Aquabacterium sp.]
QRQGIGKHLIEETRRRLGRECMVVLLAAPKAHDYYPKLGFEHNPRAWVLKGDFPASGPRCAASHAADSTPS